MKLVLCLTCVTLMTSLISANIIFEEPRYTVSLAELPSIFVPRSNVTLNRDTYPLAVEAVLSVALKLQAINNYDGRQKNFLVSPLAVAGALGQLMLGAGRDLNRQIKTLLTLRNQNDSETIVQQRITNSADPSPAEGVGSKYGTIAAKDIESFLHQRSDMPIRMLTNTVLELHRQLGRLIHDLSSPLPVPGAPHPLINSSYLHTSSAVFVDRNLILNENFVHAIIDFYDSRVVALNFRDNPTEAQNTVNNWGATETGGLINQFLTYPPPLDTAVIQAIAVHFRGAWQAPFIPEATIPGFFKTSENSEVQVKYMRGSFEEAYYADNPTLGLRLLALPYSNFDCAMYVVLPSETHQHKFNVGHLISQLTSKHLADLIDMAKVRRVNVMFPKLSLTGSLSLVEALEKHADFLNKQEVRQNTGNRNGNVDITSRNDPAAVPEFIQNRGQQNSTPKISLTLTEAATDSKFRISDIIQQIALEINEAGTEAAAIAGSTINYSGDVKNFKVNRPFLFFIRHEATNAILFWGTIVDPSA